ECPPHRSMNDPDDILRMWDKTETSRALSAAGLRVPEVLPPPAGYEELRATMEAACADRVFLKLRYGSSASGTVAYRMRSGREAAWTTVELEDGKLFNTRRIRHLDRNRDIRPLVDSVCAHATHLERWLPKHCLGGRPFDLRVLCIAGRPAHVVGRSSATPLTNLHLLNRRLPSEALQDRLPGWTAAMEACARAAAVFPSSFHVGLDVAILAGGKAHAILEANAFGDLLPGVLWNGLSTHLAELLEWER
ncbi:MAG: STM4014 family protein, partial [Candidatus Eremiobacterota bacterium]